MLTIHSDLSSKIIISIFKQGDTEGEGVKSQCSHHCCDFAVRSTRPMLILNVDPDLEMFIFLRKGAPWATYQIYQMFPYKYWPRNQHNIWPSLLLSLSPAEADILKDVQEGVCVCVVWVEISADVGTRRATLFTHKCSEAPTAEEKRDGSRLLHRDWMIILILWKQWRAHASMRHIAQSDNCFLLSVSFKKTFPRKLKCYLNFYDATDLKRIPQYSSAFQGGNDLLFFKRNLPENISIYGSVASLCHMLVFHFVKNLWLAGSRPQKEDIDCFTVSLLW